MRFVIDALGIGKPGGGRTAALGGLCSVLRLDSENRYTVVVNSPEEALTRFPNVEELIFSLPNRLAAHLFAQVAIPLVARARGAALVHHTKHLGSLFNACPYVVTINDMTTLRLPWTQSRIDVAYWKTVQRTVARRAALVLAPSADAKRDLIHYYGLAGNRIRLVPYAPAAIFRPQAEAQVDAMTRARYGISGGYILFVGILALKKNIPTLIRAYRILRKEGGYTGKLVIVGRDYPQSRERGLRDLVAQLNLQEQVIFAGAVPDEDLPAFYRGADVFAFPSLHEGFGIVLLEAMSCGAPVVASDASSLPEVVADAGVLIKDLRQPTAWAEALGQVIFQGQARQNLIERGLRRASEFTWEAVGRETLAAYESAARYAANTYG